MNGHRLDGNDNGRPTAGRAVITVTADRANVSHGAPRDTVGIARRRSSARAVAKLNFSRPLEALVKLLVFENSRHLLLRRRWEVKIKFFDRGGKILASSFDNGLLQLHDAPVLDVDEHLDVVLLRGAAGDVRPLDAALHSGGGGASANDLERVRERERARARARESERESD